MDAQFVRVARGTCGDASNPRLPSASSLPSNAFDRRAFDVHSWAGAACQAEERQLRKLPRACECGRRHERSRAARAAERELGRGVLSVPSVLFDTCSLRGHSQAFPVSAVSRGRMLTQTRELTYASKGPVAECQNARCNLRNAFCFNTTHHAPVHKQYIHIAMPLLSFYQEVRRSRPGSELFQVCIDA